MAGTNIRLFSRKFYERYMEEHDRPEISTAPLGKLFIDALFFTEAWNKAQRKKM